MYVYIYIYVYNIYIEALARVDANVDVSFFWLEKK
jgi:hypothetical protein